jgi:ubiquinone/menaquinone biosynthesis C-methylase UbiE
MGAMTDRMLAEAALAPGARVLDLGTGTGDTAILASERVGKSGSVLATDASPTMVEAARDAVKAAGAANVEVRVMDASAIDVQPGAYDAVIARLVLMFVDRPRALAGVLRALRTGGRFAGAVWGPLADNPYHRILLDVVRARGGWGEPAPQVVRAFSVEDAGEWRRVLEGAGLSDVAVVAVPGERRFASVDDAMVAMRESPMHREPLERLPPEAWEEAWGAIEKVCRARAEGGVFPTQHLVIRGRK